METATEVKTVDWFKTRVGKTVYRENNGCDCFTCKRASRTGVVLLSEPHAFTIYNLSQELGLEYFDEPQR